MKKFIFILVALFAFNIASASITKDNIKDDPSTCLTYDESITASVYTPLYVDIYQSEVPNYDGPCGGPTSSCWCDTTGPYCYMTCTDPDGSSVSLRVPCPIGNNG